MNIVKEHSENNLTLRLFDNDIVEMSRPEDWDRHETLEDAKWVQGQLEDFVGDTKYRLLVYQSDAPVSNEARWYYEKQDPVCCACAIVAENAMQRLIGNLFIDYTTIGKKIPFKMFRNKEKAVTWLMTFAIHEKN